MTIYTLDAFKKFAKQLAKRAQVGTVFLLKGDLGAGKTTFAQAFIQARYPNTTVTSPTFSICQEYGDIVHYDLYRINDAAELDQLDFFEHLHNKICLIEWPERIRPLSSIQNEHTHLIKITPGPSPDTRCVQALNHPFLF